MTDDDQSVREPAGTRTDEEPGPLQKPTGAVRGHRFADGDGVLPVDDVDASASTADYGRHGVSSVDGDSVGGEGNEEEDAKPGAFWRELPVLIAVALGLA